MAFLNALNINASGLTAQRMRLDIISENVANADTTRTEQGGPYRRKMVVFQPIAGGFRRKLLQASGKTGGGVQVTAIVEDTRPFQLVYDPNHPDANAEGYVEMPNVDTLKETVDAMAATRAYEANITALNALNMMAAKALEIGR